MGRGWALVDLASRLSRQKERAEAVAMAADIFAEAPARVGGARPLLALGALARRDALSQMKDRRVGSPGRQLRMLRSEEHTSELQSLMRNSYAVFCLKKKKTQNTQTQQKNIWQSVNDNNRHTTYTNK